MVEILSVTPKLSDGTPVTLTLLADVTEETTGDELQLEVRTPTGVLKIVEIPRKPFTLAGIGLYKVGDVEDKSDWQG